MRKGYSMEEGTASFDYTRYLEAKAKLDNRCRNMQVWRTFLSALRKVHHPRILDVGTGTGMMLRRLLGELTGGAELWGLELDGRLCATARETVEPELDDQVMVIREGDFLDPDSIAPAETGFDFVTANAFLDLVPLYGAVGRIKGLLREGGVLYAAINYDGITELFPSSEDQSFEDCLIRVYNRSMDDRRVGGRATGGSRTGASLIRTLEAEGFSVRAAGPSDWTVFPAGRGYAEGEQYFLYCLLSMLYREGAASSLAGRQLDEWLRARQRHLRGGVLGLLTHQVDLLACREDR